MGWLENAFGLEPEPPATRQAPEPTVHGFYFQTRAPNGDDTVGAVEVGWYIVDRGVVTLCDEHGKATETSCRLAPGDDARQVASRLKRREWLKGNGSDFNRPLNYGPLGLA